MPSVVRFRGELHRVTCMQSTHDVVDEASRRARSSPTRAEAELNAAIDGIQGSVRRRKVGPTMPNLHDIERRIKSVASTKQITRTMEMVAGCEDPSCHRACSEAATPYGNCYERNAGQASRRTGGYDCTAYCRQHDEVKRDPVLWSWPRTVAWQAASIRSVLRRAEKIMKERKAAGHRGRLLSPVARRPIGYFKYPWRRCRYLLSATCPLTLRVEEAARSGRLRRRGISSARRRLTRSVARVQPLQRTLASRFSMQQPSVAGRHRRHSVPKGEGSVKDGGITEPTADNPDLPRCCRLRARARQMFCDHFLPAYLRRSLLLCADRLSCC